MANIYDVAQAAGVSISTVSHVLNETRFVSEETKAKVLEAIEQLDYHPSSLARALVRQETQTIGLIVPDNINPFFAELARGIENYGFGAGYNVLLCNSDRNPSKEIAYLDMLLSKRVDGVIYMTNDNAQERLHRLKERNIPVVVFDREYEGLDAILIDNEGGGVDATVHLLQLGHQRVACIGGPSSRFRTIGRVRGYQSALAQAGIPAAPELVTTGDWTYESGWEAMRILMQLSPPPTAIFACNDTMAVGALAFLHEANISVPEEVSVIGFDNILLSAFTSPPLTTMATPIVELGQQLCQMLLERIQNQSLTPQRKIVHSKLLVRSSTAPRATPVAPLPNLKESPGEVWAS
jgi:LacI family transcriptional regulator